MHIIYFSHRDTMYLPTPLAELMQPCMGSVPIKLNHYPRMKENLTLNQFVVWITTKKSMLQNKTTGSVHGWVSLKLRSHFYVEWTINFMQNSYCMYLPWGIVCYERQNKNWGLDLSKCQETQVLLNSMHVQYLLFWFNSTSV